MKTAISIDDNLFREVERYATEHHFKRSEIIASALRIFFERVKTQQMLESLNEAYSDAETAEDVRRLASAKARHAKRLAKEP